LTLKRRKYESNKILPFFDHCRIDIPPPSPLNAQISQGGLPYSFTHTVSDSIPTITLPPVNVDSLLQVEELEIGKKPYLYGYLHNVNLNITNSGKLETLSDGNMLWRISIYSLTGQQIATLVDATQTAGHYHVQWQGTDDTGIPVASGLYFYHLKTDGFEKTHKMLLLK